MKSDDTDETPDWMRPRPPLPGPVASEAFQMSVSERERTVWDTVKGVHYATGHAGDFTDCLKCTRPDLAG